VEAEVTCASRDKVCRKPLYCHGCTMNQTHRDFDVLCQRHRKQSAILPLGSTEWCRSDWLRLLSTQIAALRTPCGFDCYRSISSPFFRKLSCQIKGTSTFFSPLKFNTSHETTHSSRECNFSPFYTRRAYIFTTADRFPIGPT
jgi:hypothetical protein